MDAHETLRLAQFEKVVTISPGKMKREPRVLAEGRWKAVKPENQRNWTLAEY